MLGAHALRTKQKVEKKEKQRQKRDRLNAEHAHEQQQRSAHVAAIHAEDSAQQLDMSGLRIHHHHHHNDNGEYEDGSRPSRQGKQPTSSSGRRSVSPAPPLKDDVQQQRRRHTQTAEQLAADPRLIARLGAARHSLHDAHLQRLHIANHLVVKATATMTSSAGGGKRSAKRSQSHREPTSNEERKSVGRGRSFLRWLGFGGGQHQQQQHPDEQEQVANKNDEGERMKELMRVQRRLSTYT